jgi:hypothetical protein
LENEGVMSERNERGVVPTPKKSAALTVCDQIRIVEVSFSLSVVIRRSRAESQSFQHVATRPIGVDLPPCRDDLVRGVPVIRGGQVDHAAMTKGRLGQIG